MHCKCPLSGVKRTCLDGLAGDNFCSSRGDPGCCLPNAVDAKCPLGLSVRESLLLLADEVIE